MSKTVTIWEKLKLQIDNLEEMHKQNEVGKDVSVSVYWQMETLYEILNSVEEKLGGDKIRQRYEELEKED